MKKKTSSNTNLIVILLGIVGIGGGYYVFNRMKNQQALPQPSTGTNVPTSVGSSSNTGNIIDGFIDVIGSIFSNKKNTGTRTRRIELSNTDASGKNITVSYAGQSVRVGHTQISLFTINNNRPPIILSEIVATAPDIDRLTFSANGSYAEINFTSGNIITK